MRPPLGSKIRGPYSQLRPFSRPSGRKVFGIGPKTIKNPLLGIFGSRSIFAKIHFWGFWHRHEFFEGLKKLCCSQQMRWHLLLAAGIFFRTKQFFDVSKNCGLATNADAHLLLALGFFFFFFFVGYLGWRFLIRILLPFGRDSSLASNVEPKIATIENFKSLREWKFATVTTFRRFARSQKKEPRWRLAAGAGFSLRDGFRSFAIFDFFHIFKT